jgi:hypothetical protein
MQRAVAFVRVGRRTLDEIAPAGVATGERYPPRSVSTVFR